MRECLIKRYDFLPENITVMMDTETTFSTVIPTSSNVVTHLYNMVKNFKAGDLSVCYYTRHGGRCIVREPQIKMLNYIEYLKAVENTIIAGNFQSFFLLFICFRLFSCFIDAKSRHKKKKPIEA
jgi:hypothetical protein